jgi:1,4-alpha-glucan branching enzyme
MGWMSDTLEYFSKDPVHRRWHHHQLTFALLYAFHENFILPLSHDEVVHGKGSLLSKMPGDRWQQFANLRALLAWMWAHPGRQLLFMGGELAQNDEWHHDRSLDWHLLDYPEHSGVHRLVQALNHRYRREPALWERDFEWSGFRWIDPSDTDNAVLSFVRWSADASRAVACVANLTPVVRWDYRVGLPRSGRWVETLNTDWLEFGGTGVGNSEIHSEEVAWHQLDHSAVLTLPPLAVTWLTPGSQEPAE